MSSLHKHAAIPLRYVFSTVPLETGVQSLLMGIISGKWQSIHIDQACFPIGPNVNLPSHSAEVTGC